MGKMAETFCGVIVGHGLADHLIFKTIFFKNCFVIYHRLVSINRHIYTLYLGIKPLEFFKRLSGNIGWSFVSSTAIESVVLSELKTLWLKSQMNRHSCLLIFRSNL